MITEVFLYGIHATLLIQCLLKVRRVLVVVPNQLLYAFIILYGFHFLNFILVSLNFPGLTIHFYKIPFVINAMLIPTAFLYVRKVVSKSNTWHSRDLWHSVLPLTVTAVMIPWYIQSGAVKRQHWENFGPHGGFTGVEQLTGFVIFLVLSTYLVFQISDYLKLAKGAFKSPDTVQSERILNWIGALNAFVVVLTVLSMVYTLIRVFHLPEWINAILRILWLLTLIALLWSLNENPRVLDLLPAGHNKVVGQKVKVPDYLYILKKSKVYLNPDLSLYQFALMCGTSVTVTSKEIKRQSGQSFNQFINNQRINYFIQNLNPESIQSQTIEGLALSSGFKSRASFYRAFKSVTETTPSEWITQHFSEKAVLKTS